MTNTPVQVDEAMSVICAGTHATEHDLEVAEAILAHVGKVMRMSEDHLDAVTALSGSGPAYFFLLAEAMIDAGILLGLPRDISTDLIVQTMVGQRQDAARHGQASGRAARDGDLAGRHHHRGDPAARERPGPGRLPRRDRGREDPRRGARRWRLSRPPTVGSPGGVGGAGATTSPRLAGPNRTYAGGRTSSRCPVRRSLPALVALLVLVAACSGEETPTIETAEVSRGEVVQTVAAAAAIDPAGVVTVTAPVSGEIDELFVADGDEVAVGDPLVRLASETIDQQIAQAEAAVDAAGALSGLSAGAGLDLAPVLGAFRSQFDTVLPSLLGVLEAQVDATEAALVGVLETAAEATSAAGAAADELTTAVAQAIAEGRLEGTDPDDLDPELFAALEELEDREGRVDQRAIDEAIRDARQQAAAARAQLAAAETAFQEASFDLQGAEQAASQQTRQAAAAQTAAVQAQRTQAQQALEAARALTEDLTILAPAAGTVELARGDAGGCRASVSSGARTSGTSAASPVRSVGPSDRRRPRPARSRRGWRSGAANRC
jgi:multidrug efflux pump subunit AcrA (membrane-fusion protein)